MRPSPLLVTRQYIGVREAARRPHPRSRRRRPPRRRPPHRSRRRPHRRRRPRPHRRRRLRRRPRRVQSLFELTRPRPHRRCRCRQRTVAAISSSSSAWPSASGFLVWWCFFSPGSIETVALQRQHHLHPGMQPQATRVAASRSRVGSKWRERRQRIILPPASLRCPPPPTPPTPHTRLTPSSPPPRRLIFAPQPACPLVTRLRRERWW